MQNLFRTINFRWILQTAKCHQNSSFHILQNQSHVVGGPSTGPSATPTLDESGCYNTGKNGGHSRSLKTLSYTAVYVGKKSDNFFLEARYMLLSDKIIKRQDYLRIVMSDNANKENI